MAIPSHPDHEDDAVAGEEKAPSWRIKMLIAVIVVVLVAMIALHLAGVFSP